MREDTEKRLPDHVSTQRKLYHERGYRGNYTRREYTEETIP